MIPGVTTLVLLLSALTSPGQQAVRQPMTGQVRGLDGAAVAEATVHFVSNLVPGRPDLPGHDSVEVHSDADGKYQAALLEGRSYVAWVLKAGEGEAYACSDIVSGIQGPGRQDLWLRNTSRRTWLTLTGVAGEGLRYQLELGRGHVERAAIEAPEGDRLLLPPLPEGQAGLRILAADGRPILERRLYTLGRESQGVAASPLEVQRRVVVVEAAGEPVAGARVLAQTNGFDHWPTSLGLTDAQGRLEVELEGRRINNTIFLGNSALLVLADGHAGRYQRIRFQIEDDAPIRLTLQPGIRARGRILDAEGRGRPGVVVLAQTTWQQNDKPGTRYHSRHPLTAVTDVEGRFELASIDASSACRVVALVDGEHWVLASGTVPAADLELGDIGPGSLCRFEVLARESDGRPAAFARLALGEPEHDNTGLRSVVWGTPIDADRRGRIVVRLAPSMKLLVAGCHSGALADTLLEARAQGGGEERARLVFPALVTLRGTLGGVQAASLEGVEVRASLSLNGKRRNNLESRLDRSVRVRSGADGSFAIRLPAEGSGNLFVQDTVLVDGKPIGVNGRHRLVSIQNGAEDIVIELSPSGDRTKLRGAAGIQLGGRALPVPIPIPPGRPAQKGPGQEAPAQPAPAPPDRKQP